MRISHHLVPVFVLSFVAIDIAHAQCEPGWSDQFAPFEFDGHVHAAVGFDDGSGTALYIAGELTHVDDHPAWNIARWRRGHGWMPLSTGIVGHVSEGMMDASVYALAIFDDGSGPALYAAGEFTTAGDVPCSSIARWRDGQWTSVGGGFTGALHDVRVHSLCVHDDGSGPALYAGGNFTGAGGVAVNKIARWDGTSWSALGGGIDGPQGHTVYALASYGGELYAGGEFLGAEGISAPSLVRWNGTSWSLAGGGANGIVYALEVFDDGGGTQLFAGGSFSLLGVPAPRIARWNGSSWSAPATGPGDTVLAFEAFDSGAGADLYVGGAFTHVGGTSMGSVVRWNGGAWAQLTGGGPGIVVRALAAFEDADGARLVAGGTGDIGTSQNPGITTWDGARWAPKTQRFGGLGENTGPSAPRVEALHAIDHGAGLGRWLYVGGRFNGVHATPTTRNLARFDGFRWVSVGNIAVSSTGEARVSALGAFDDGSGEKLVVAGRFDHIGAFAARSIATFDGTTWSALGAGLSLSSQAASVTDVTAYDDGGGRDLFAIGSIDTAGATAVNDIARWDGTSWADVSLSSASVTLEALIAFDDGNGEKLYVGGNIPNGSPDETLVVRWDGTSWVDVSAGLVAHDAPTAFGKFDDGGGTRLYVGTQSARVYRWNGAAWSVVITQLVGFVSALYSHDDGSGPALHIAGRFSPFNLGNLARWNGTMLSSVGGHPDDSVFAITAFDAGVGAQLYIGGTFGTIYPSTTGTIDADAIARWGSPCLEPGDPFCAGDGSATPCPCSNTGARGHGCANSFDVDGAHLAASGVASVSGDTLRLDATAVSNSLVTFIQGTLEHNSGLGTVFGDGLRCAGGTVIRLESVLAAGNAASYPASGQMPISERGRIPLVGNVTRTYQACYRNIASFCTPMTFNLTNGVRTFWRP